MSKSSGGGFFSSLINFIVSLFGGKKTPQPTPTTPTPPPGHVPAVIVTRRVLMVVYDPIIDPTTGMKLSQKMNWRNADDLTASFISDILETSGGMARYQVIQRVDADEFPAKADGFRYTAQSYLDAYHGTTPVHDPDSVDYQAILQKFNIIQRVTANEIDEVWLVGFPHAGFKESIMGGVGAFWCNSNPLPNTSTCPRRFIIMGFSLERGVGEMHESFGHRAESIMQQVYEKQRPDSNMWARFIRYDKEFPGQSQVGNIHYAPNSEQDYDWGNQRMVTSYCDDWYNYPNFKNISKQVNCAEWGNGDIRGHHVWWLKHLPKTSGQINGIANNWWQYIMDPGRVSI